MFELEILTLEPQSSSAGRKPKKPAKRDASTTHGKQSQNADLRQGTAPKMDLSAGTRILDPQPDTLKQTKCVKSMVFISGIYLNPKPQDSQATVFNSPTGWKQYLTTYFPNTKIYFVQTFLKPEHEQAATKAQKLEKAETPQPTKQLAQQLLAKFQELKVQTPLPVLAHGAGGRIAVNLLDLKPDFASHLIIFGTRFFKRRFIRELLVEVIKKFKLPRALEKIVLPERFDSKTATRAWWTLWDEDLSDILPKINVPTLLLWGDRDLGNPFVNAIEAQRKIKNSIFRILVDGTYYEPYKSVLDELAKLIAKFVCNLSAR